MDKNKITQKHLPIDWLGNKCPHIYDLRWRFEYNDGKKARYGQWSMFTQNKTDMASFVSTTNLARALIEWRDIRTRVEGVGVEAPGQDFCLFQWEGCGVFPGMANTKKFLQAGQSMATGVLGLTIVTRDERATLWRDGRLTAQARDPNEIKIQYATYGK